MRISFNSNKFNINSEISVSPDKSITHRAIMLGSIAEGTTTVHNYLASEDCLATLNIMKNLGVNIEQYDNKLIVKGKSLTGLSEARVVLNAKNSGTTMRLLTGILVGQKFMSIITGDISLNSRPMKRIIEPLQNMGANIHSRSNNSYAPICVLPTAELTAQEHIPSVASAQVKSCLLFAGLYANGTTVVKELAQTRDHSERMLTAMGVKLNIERNKIYLNGGQNLRAIDIHVPGDFSTAAYFIALALCVPNSRLSIKNVGINETRIGLLNVLSKMGAKITLDNEVTKNNEKSADLLIEYTKLSSVVVTEQEIATLIDEVPLLAVIATHAKGTTEIKGIEELKHKESNRLNAIVTELSRIGAAIKTDGKNLYITGEVTIQSNKEYCFEHYNDHRIAMSMAVCALSYNLKAIINGAEIVNISSPSFWNTLTSIVSSKSMEVDE